MKFISISELSIVSHFLSAFNDLLSGYISEEKFLLSRLFRKHTGKTFIDYLNDMRIEQSEDQLRQTGDLLSEIAYSCGFSSARHFAKMFKRKKGMSPGLFRRNL